MKPFLFFAAFLLLSGNAFAQQPKQTAVVVVDFVKTKPGQYADALKYYEAGWMKARIEAKKQKYIVSYKLLTLGDVSEGDWNIMLLTEYADKQSYDASEGNFQKVFAKILPKLPAANGKTGGDLRTVVMSKVMNAPSVEVTKQ